MPFVVKTTHILVEEYHKLYKDHQHNEAESHDHDCGTCPICHFNYYSFTEATTIALAYCPIEYNVEHIYITLRLKEASALEFFQLRAPPTIG